MNQRWIVVLAMLLLAVGVGVVAFNAGVQHGVVEAGKAVAPAPGAGAYPGPYPYYGWHRPFGFPFFFVPLFFFAFWILVARGLFWGRCGGRLCPQPYWGRSEEWHRRMHERMGEEAPRGETGPRLSSQPNWE